MTTPASPSAPTLTTLPPELLDQIISYIPTARSVASLAQTNKHLHASIEKDDAWKTFNTSRFPTLLPHAPPSGTQKDVARTLTTLSRAWDRRAFVARYIEPRGEIHSFPGDNRVERWKRPRGQTIGFTPLLDCFEEVGSAWRERSEVLAFSAGAGLCVRQKEIGVAGGEDVRWMVYRPVGAAEGIDDVTTLHLLRPGEGEKESRKPLELVVGTANGDLQLLQLSAGSAEDLPKARFVTQGQPVRSSSLLQHSREMPLLAANTGDDCVSLYPMDTEESTIHPSSSINIPRPTSNGSRPYRTWSTNFLSPDNLAIGLGPSTQPIHIYSITSSGIAEEALRKYHFEDDLVRVNGETNVVNSATKSMTSVYPITPLNPSHTSATNREGQVFLSGALDGVIRLHDLRSDRQVEQKYIDPTDDSAIYSLLPRGKETLVAGASRHSLLKVFDMRLGSRAYSYLHTNNSNSSTTKSPNTASSRPAPHVTAKQSQDWNLFLKPHTATYPGRGGGNNWARRSAESSLYSLASASPHSPYIYAGVENAVVELAFTSILDSHPDPVFFPPAHGAADNTRARDRDGDRREGVQGFRTKEVLDLAMYEQTREGEMMRLRTQRSFWETFRGCERGWEVLGRAGGGSGARGGRLEGLDERWMDVGG